jgi:beta-N-acetylhexosaminidase
MGMRRCEFAVRCTLLVVVVLALLFSASAFAFAAATPTAEVQQDLSTWTEQDLAAQLLMVGVYAPTTGKLTKLTKQGVGGVVLLGPIPKKLSSQLKRAGNKARGGIRPLVASDEEGGQVQRFRKRIYPLPAAQTMGGWSKKRISTTTQAYARRLKRYGVNVVLGPVVDLKVKGKYLSQQQRCFAASPRVVAVKAQAWSSGMKKAGLMTCYKHWPGMGTAGNTHKKVTSVRSFAALKKRDLIPFQAASKAASKATSKHRSDLVMVAHVTAAGLTEKSTPASLSPKAYVMLRKQTGKHTLIITDSLSMGATTKSQGISTTTACIRALAAGADMALVATAKDSKALIAAVAKAIADGRIPRAQAEASAQRILALKAKHGLN